MPDNRTKPSSTDRTRRYPRGRGSALSLADRAVIQGLSLAGLSGAEISRRLGRSQRTVGKVLSSDEYKHAKDLARSVLAQHATDFADDLVISSKIAALSGRHEPARDALLALGVIEPPTKSEKAPPLTIQIGVAIPGLGSTAHQNVSFPGGTRQSALTGDIVEQN
jgi:hypothetical protein